MGRRRSFCPGADQVSLDAVEVPQPVEGEFVESGDLVQGLAGLHDVDALLVARGPQPQLLTRTDAVPVQFVELPQPQQLLVEPEGDLREGVAGPNHVAFRWLRAARGHPLQPEGLADPDGVAGDSVQAAQTLGGGAVGGGDLGEGVPRAHDVRWRAWPAPRVPGADGSPDRAGCGRPTGR